MHLGAAQLFVGGDFAGGGLEQGRASQEGLGTAAHHDHIVGHAGQVGAAGGRVAVHHAHLRNAFGRQPRLIGEAAAAFDEYLTDVHQVGAARFDQPHHRQFVLQRDGFGAQALAQAHRRDGAALDGAVRRDHHAADARDRADAADDPAAQHVLLAVVVVHPEAGQGRELEPRRTAVEQQCDALARQQLFAGTELGLLAVRGVAHTVFERAKTLDQREHLRALALEALGLRIDLTLNDWHGRLSLNGRSE